MNELANAMASGFASLGVERGDTVAVMMESCPDYVWATLGLNKLGAIWVPTNTDYKGQWLRESLEDSRAKVLVVDEALLPRVAEAGGKLPFQHVVVRGNPKASPLAAPALALAELERAPAKEPDDAALFMGDTAAILWTSGTTGRSKGVMQSHNVWIRAALDGATNSHLREGEVIYSCLPMYQSAAWVANLYRALVSGVPCAIDERFSVGEFWDRCRYYGATMVFTLGAMHIFLWQQPPRPDDADNPVRSAGMVPMPEAMIEPFKKRFGIEHIHQGYGQSEVMALLARRPGKTYKANSLGEPADGIEVKLLDERDFEVAPGEVGEFAIRPIEPYAIFNGYFHDAEATVRAWSNLWYHSRRPRPARRGRRVLLRRPQEGLHPLQGAEHLVVPGRGRVHGARGGGAVRGARGDLGRARGRGGDEAVRGAEAGPDGHARGAVPLRERHARPTSSCRATSS